MALTPDTYATQDTARQTPTNELATPESQGLRNPKPSQKAAESNIDTDQGRSPDTGDAGPATETATDGGSSGNGNGSKSSGSSSTGSSSEEEEDDDEATRRPAKRQKLALYPVELYVAVLAKPDGRTTRRRVVGLHCIAAGWKPTTVAEMRAAVMCSAAVTKEANVQTPGDLQFTRPDLDADTKAPIRLSDSQLVQDVTQQYRAAMTQSDGKVTLYLEQRPLQSMMTTGEMVGDGVARP
ncbi:hypothetical protein TSOC_011228 [Tetrabaena socialis]|uniref:Uncharacterized protein n=1 Tax=Tetrabaena socialis TaxID=47790 RepID=A0A2J7ZR91_9CHLO|nr:hypothetical protein TSOC_011228 [Tetrabaena socialis]|eukprot:PNH02760.1 hypothetical protein TSOC_011228 [Tetrabaena socialis]